MNAEGASSPAQRPHGVSSASLAGATALVTGAGRGIGAATAFALASAGADEVVLVSRTRAELEKVAEEIQQLGTRTRVEPCDLRDGAAIKGVIGSLPRLDVLVNNAGMNIPALLVDVTEADLDAVLSLNVRAAILVAQAATRKMLESSAAERGAAGRSIINVTSQMGRVGAPRRTIYCATKHAIEGLTKAMAVELAPFGIRVNAVAPSFLDTPMTAPFFARDASFHQWVLDRIPLGRLGTVKEVAAVIAFLASPAAAFVTGESVAIDGGWTAQ
jgi:NAD(P)-dependent dehydrogenase (short-subunit alcohol dehydrogenase family)